MKATQFASTPAQANTLPGFSTYMKTPDGRECKFFYGDYYRGRNFEECRALINPQDKKDWNSAVCKSCPVPAILQNNACPNMALTTYFQKSLFGKRIRVKAWCSRSHGIVRNPNVGCGLCHLPQEAEKR